MKQIHRSERFSHQTGQVGLVVLLIMTALLSVGVSAVNKSTQDLKITRDEVDSSITFNAAESRMEVALQQLDEHFESGTSLPPNWQTETVSGMKVEHFFSNSEVFEMLVADNTVVTLNASGLSNNTWAVKWGSDALGCDNPSLVAAAYKDTPPYTVRRWAVRPNGCSPESGFDEGGTVSGDFHSTYNFPFVPDEGIIRIRVLGGQPTLLSAQATGVPAAQVPKQIHIVKAKAQKTEGGSAKAIEVRRSLPSLPYIFDFALFSGTNIVKN